MASNAQRMGLPMRPFLYTVDQIAALLELSEVTVKTQYLHYEGRQVGVRAYNKLKAHNIAPDGEKPEWRVTEEELVRWLRHKGFKIYVRGFARS